MFKTIPGNPTLQISLDKKIRNIKGWECAPKLLENNLIEIELYNKNRFVSLEWLSLISHFEVNLPEGKKHRLFDIDFTDYKLNKVNKTHANKLMVFIKPLTYKPGYRIIPNFTRYAINHTGTRIIDIENNKDVAIYSDAENAYPRTYIYNPDKGSFTKVLVHRLVALAWVHNNDYYNKTIINHIDGNKQNPHASNLEWCSYSENIRHAVNNDLRNDNHSCKIRSAITGEIKEFKSLRQAFEYMGIDPTSKMFSKQYKLRHRLINGEYEIKYADDQTPWFYERHALGTKAGRFNLHVVFDDGTEKDYPSIEHFKKIYGVWNTSNINELVSKAESMYPNMKIMIEDNFVVEEVQAYHIETGKVLEFKSVRSLYDTLGLIKTKVRNILRKGIPYNYNGYIIRYKSDEPWDLNVIDNSNKSRRILAYKSDSSEEKLFYSLREAAKYFDVSRQFLKRIIGSDIHLKGWLLRESSDD